MSPRLSPSHSMRGLRFMFYNRKYLSSCWWRHAPDSYRKTSWITPSFYWSQPATGGCRTIDVKPHQYPPPPPLLGKRHSSSFEILLVAVFKFLSSEKTFEPRGKASQCWQPWQLCHREWWIILIFLYQSVAILTRHKTPTLKLNWIM